MIGELSGCPAPRPRPGPTELLERVRPHRRRRPHGQGLLGRHAPPARPGRQPRHAARRSCSSTSPPPASTPPAGMRMWDVIRDLVADGTTLLLTTQYLDEADELADRISVIDHGRVIADGTATRAQGHHRRRAARGHPGRRPSAAAAGALAAARHRRRHDQRRRPHAARRRSTAGSGLATAVIRALDAAGVAVDDVAVPPPVARRRVLRPHRPPGRATDARPTPSSASRSPDDRRRTGPTADHRPPPTSRDRPHRPRQSPGEWVARRRRADLPQPASTSAASRRSCPTPPSSRCCSRCCSSTSSARPWRIPGGGAYKDFAIGGLLTMNLTTASMGTAVGHELRPVAPA